MLGRKEINEVIKHYIDEGVPRSTMCSIIKRYENCLPAQNMQRMDRRPKINKYTLKKLKNAVQSRVSAIQIKLTRKFKVSRRCIGYNLNKLGLKYYKTTK